VREPENKTLGEMDRTIGRVLYGKTGVGMNCTQSVNKIYKAETIQKNVPTATLLINNNRDTLQHQQIERQRVFPRLV